MTSKNDIAVIYLYCDEHARSQQNFENFAANGPIKNIDFFVAGSKIKLSDNQDKLSKFTEVSCNYEEHDHKKISRFYRDHVQKSDYQSVVVVSSIMSGPYSVKDSAQNWVQRFTNKLTNETHLVGSSIVIMPPDHPLTELQNGSKAKVDLAPYVPTSAFAISKEALDFLETQCFFDQEIPNCEISLKFLYEMRMSALMLKNGWNISCLLPKYSDIDFRSLKKDPNRTSWIGDPSPENCYFGENIDKHESIFVETPDFEADCSMSHLKPSKNVELFGIFYDEQSRSAITNGFIPLDNSKGPEYLYESYPIMRQLNSNRPEEGTWCGFFSPKFHEKTQITYNDICNEIQQADEDVSVILFSSHWEQVSLWPNIWLQGDIYHPGLVTLTKKVIDLAGYEIDIKKTYSTLNYGVFSNYMVAKNEFWLEWSRLVSIYYELITNNDRLFTISTPYQSNTVPIHTFVIERLASLIILELGLKTKFSQTLYARSLNSNSVDGSEAIRMNRYKSKFNETGNESYVLLYNYHIEKINERHKQKLMKRLLSKQQANCVA